MDLPTLSHISDQDLKVKLQVLRQSERQAIAEMVLHLYEIDRRGLYRDMGYPSLFVYCTEGLGYSAGGAHRRVQAARCLRDHPEVYEKLNSGVLTLCAVSEVSKVKIPQKRQELLLASEGKSKEQVRALVLEHLPPEKPRVSTVEMKRVVVERGQLFSPAPGSGSTLEPIKTEERYNIRMEVDREFMNLYEEALSLSGGPMVEVFRRALRTFCDKRSPVKREHRRGARNGTPHESTSPGNRSIPVPVRDKVFIRDGARCTYEASDGKRCSETHALEIDHTQPYGMGGSNDLENLRLLCRTHNMLMAERAYGTSVWNQIGCA